MKKADSERGGHQAFPNVPEQVVKNELFRLSAQKIIASVWRRSLPFGEARRCIS